MASPQSKHKSSDSNEPSGKCTASLLALDSNDAEGHREAKAKTPRLEVFELGNDSDAEDAEPSTEHDTLNLFEPASPLYGDLICDIG